MWTIMQNLRGFIDRFNSPTKSSTEKKESDSKRNSKSDKKVSRISELIKENKPVEKTRSDHKIEEKNPKLSTDRKVRSDGLLHRIFDYLKPNSNSKTPGNTLLKNKDESFVEIVAVKNPISETKQETVPNQKEIIKSVDSISKKPSKFFNKVFPGVF